MKKTILDLINVVLEKLEEAGIPKTPEAVRLVYETGNTESKYKHLEQVQGPAVSFWQIEPNTIDDIWNNYVLFRKDLIQVFYELGYLENKPVFSVMTNLAVAIAMCRVYYYRKPGVIPKTISDRASYWKRHYNTKYGKGTPKHYISSN